MTRQGPRGSVLRQARQSDAQPVGIPEARSERPLGQRPSAASGELRGRHHVHPLDGGPQLKPYARRVPDAHRIYPAGFPCLGSWLFVRRLVTENTRILWRRHPPADLPAFVVLPDPRGFRRVGRSIGAPDFSWRRTREPHSTPPASPSRTWRLQRTCRAENRQAALRLLCAHESKPHRSQSRRQFADGATDAPTSSRRACS